MTVRHTIYVEGNTFSLCNNNQGWVNISESKRGLQTSLEFTEQGSVWIEENIQLVEAEQGREGLVGRFRDKDQTLTMDARSNTGVITSPC